MRIKSPKSQSKIRHSQRLDDEFSWDMFVKWHTRSLAGRTQSAPPYLVLDSCRPYHNAMVSAVGALSRRAKCIEPTRTQIYNRVANFSAVIPTLRTSDLLLRVEE